MIRGISYLYEHVRFQKNKKLFCSSEFFEDQDLGAQHNNVSFNLSFCDLFELTRGFNVLVAIKLQVHVKDVTVNCFTC